MAAAERQVVRVEYARSLREPPWDGARSAVIFALLRAGRCKAQLESRSVTQDACIFAGYCGLVPVCEDECLADHVFRWSAAGTSTFTTAPSTPGAPWPLLRRSISALNAFAAYLRV